MVRSATAWEVEGNSGRAPTRQSCHMPDGEHSAMTTRGYLAVGVPDEDKAWWNDRVEVLKALGALVVSALATGIVVLVQRRV